MWDIKPLTLHARVGFPDGNIKFRWEIFPNSRPLRIHNRCVFDVHAGELTFSVLKREVEWLFGHPNSSSVANKGNSPVRSRMM
jgi:hypothetical protein